MACDEIFDRLRAGFVLMADLAHRDQQTSDAALPVAEEVADERNFVKKAVN